MLSSSGAGGLVALDALFTHTGITAGAIGSLSLSLSLILSLSLSLYIYIYIERER